MPNNYFKFKQFTIQQQGAAMKVGTDGVILGAWAPVGREQRRILDIGTGTGLIAIMAAQRAPDATIDAVEIEPEAARQAMQNVADSPWSERIQVHHVSLQDYALSCTERYDHIISNPPYFINSLKPTDTGRIAARHAELLPYGDLISGVNKLLAPGGYFSAIFPYEQANIFLTMAAVEGLFCRHRLHIYPSPEKDVKRMALSFCRERGDIVEEDLVIEENGRHAYSEDYKSLTGDFYIRF